MAHRFTYVHDVQEPTNIQFDGEASITHLMCYRSRGNPELSSQKLNYNLRRVLRANLT